jgi:hypothetical protein
MTIVEEVEEETIEVTETERVRRVRCDVCDDSWPEDADMEVHEFAVDPDFERQFYSITELKDLLTAHYEWVDVPVVEDMDEDRELNITVPREKVVEALDKEMSLRQGGAEYGARNTTTWKEYSNKLGSPHFYIDGDRIHHFMYSVDIEATSDDVKHVCDDCYEVVF